MSSRVWISVPGASHSTAQSRSIRARWNALPTAFQTMAFGPKRWRRSTVWRNPQWPSRYRHRVGVPASIKCSVMNSGAPGGPYLLTKTTPRRFASLPVERRFPGKRSGWWMLRASKYPNVRRANCNSGGTPPPVVTTGMQRLPAIFSTVSGWTPAIAPTSPRVKSISPVESRTLLSAPVAIFTPTN